jgi:hypothetical protein
MSEDRRDPETKKQMEAGRIASQFPPVERKTPVKQGDFRHQHEWEYVPASHSRRCKTCGVTTHG